MKITTQSNHILQSESYTLANILNLFKDLGTFSNFEEFKYGIFFDLNQLNTGGKSIKTTKFFVIGHSKLRFLKDGRVTSPLAHQAILNKWADLGMENNMYLIGMNPDNNKYYISGNVFWKATQHISNYPESKAFNLNEIKISLRSTGNIGLNSKQYNAIIKAKLADYLEELSKTPAPYQVFVSIEKFFDNLSNYLSLYKRMYSTPQATLINVEELPLIANIISLSKDQFSAYPDIAELLKLSPNRAINCQHYQETISEDDLLNINNSDYWIEKSIEDNPESEGVSLTSTVAMKILQMIIPRIINNFKIIRKHSQKSYYYWLNNDAEFLKVVLCFDPPEVHTCDDITSLANNLKNYKRDFEKEISKSQKLCRY